jgi:hypothetical protein
MGISPGPAQKEATDQATQWRDPLSSGGYEMKRSILKFEIPNATSSRQAGLTRGIPVSPRS